MRWFDVRRGIEGAAVVVWAFYAAALIWPAFERAVVEALRAGLLL